MTMQQQVTGGRSALVERLESLTNRVPKSVLSGSVQSAVAWKEQAAKARTLLSNKRSSDWQLLDAINKLEAWS